MQMFVMWIGYTALIIFGVALFCGAQWLLNGCLWGRDPDFDWWDVFVPTFVIAMIVWLPFSLGWAITAANKTAEVLSTMAAEVPVV